MKSDSRTPSRRDQAACRARALLAFVLLAGCAISRAAGAAQPCAKVDAGYVLDDVVRGPLGSNRPVNACVDVLQPQQDGSRRLRIFVDGKRVLSNDAVALGPSDGGEMGDPFQPLELGHGSLVVRNYGGGGPLRWGETWRLTIRNGQWIVAGWDEDSLDMHRAAEGGGEFHTSVNALTGDVHDSYDPREEDAPAKRAERRVCQLPPEWRSPPVARIGAIRERNWRCDAKLGKPL